ncbi:Uncharacterized protein APZ42_005408, partial [Daphnia magna]
TVVPSPVAMNEEMKAVCNKEVRDLLQKEAIKRVGLNEPFQNRRFTDSKKYHKRRGLVCKIRPKRCLFNRPYPPKPSNISLFQVEESYYRFSSLPFGLASAPRIFTKLLKVPISVLRGSGVRLVIYLDDILIMNENKQGAEKDLNTVLNLFQELGFVINWEKSILVPSQTIEYLGVIINSCFLSFTLPDQKVKSITALGEQALLETEVSL